ncbi:dienelactone hydrolase family protein [Stackebrandtia nassauensis]|uniref:Dienelactone hydrolase domain-containing protein n=1 Tax=Stackebrandtia nassauensis (strain DSM 44728 / CIP 108903 / NRRL B-16338 / NBRC 102104 / LLR-40K-21) TaxID=446470 RepID=D3PU99_STANL|nr:dienelactone hydrolase family protein [Stackebrandtia nassauensis]ADD41045.1 conserved hypothetical protein [Stackebrandtia nassauensis DSM 44728]
MTEVVLFHHSQGLTTGVRALAAELRSAGHTVHTPDLFDGRIFDSIEAGVGYANETGFRQRGVDFAAGLPAGVVYAGFSLGVMPAQQLAQTRAGAKGALLFEACVPASEFGGWPKGLPVQIHGMDADEFFAGEGDVDAARELVEGNAEAELFLYPGDKHLFADETLLSFDAEATSLLTRRVIAFLDALDD